MVTILALAACRDDCDDLRRDVDDLRLRLRVEKLEDWCNTANSQISALQGLVSALEANDYVTGVTPITEGARETGYIIQFSKSGPISIHHGTNGANGSDGKDGANGLTPLIGAAKDTDGRYYWTVQTGDAAPQWLTDAEGNKIPTTGKDGADGSDGSDGTDAQPPVISVATFEGALYWQVNGRWLLDANKAKVPVTGPAGTAGPQGPQGDQGIQGPAGPQGDAVFAPDGVMVDDQAGYVTFTLADKVTTFRLPLYGATVIRFESNEPLWINNVDGARISLIMPRFFPKSDYGGLMAEVVATSDANADIVTRSTSNNWTVKLEEPVFHDNGNIDDPYVKITPPQSPDLVGAKALLRVTLIHANGHESTVSRVLLVTDAIPCNYTLAEQLTEPGTKPQSGNGTATNPYLIESAEHLQWIKQNPEEINYYKLMKDIQVTGTGSQGNWVPIGKYAGDDETSSSTHLFQGKFDGNGKKVSGIVAPAGYRYFGFFGCCDEVEIQNLTYEGSMDLSRLTDRTVGVGAIVGYLFFGTVTHCSNSANLTCKGTVHAGGIVGIIVAYKKQKIAIEACKNTGNIETGGDVGGIAGQFSQNGSSITGCINTGNIKTTGSAEQFATIAGGIVGSTTGSIKACWSKATSITHQNNGAVGGIAGKTGKASEIEACTWKAIQGVEGIGNRNSGTTITDSLFQPFTGDRPNTTMFSTMNGTWGKENAGRNYQFNADTDEIVDKK